MESIAAARPTLIFDRQPLWLSALEQVLERNGFAVVATAVAEPHALQLLREHQPSVMVFEPEACMSAPTRFIEVALREVHGLKMIAVSQAEDSASITECLAAGVFAYVLKSAHPEDISLAARQAIHQSIHFAPGRAGTPHLAAVNSVRPASLDDGSDLTRREREILALVAEGSSNGTVARKLWVTEQTVKFHLSNIYRKLGVSNRTAASRWAHDHGMLAPEHSIDSTPAAV